ncbi:MAG: hypothetical protein HY040_24070 [Planctomycetes bacterium]|nr:hypothetical protein [Planctomycetota bacterium]
MLCAIAAQNKRRSAWDLVWGQPYIDGARLAAAIEADLLAEPKPDFRLRLLVRDASRALRSYWGNRCFARWLKASPIRKRISSILDEDLGRPGFRNLRRRLVAAPGKSEIEQIFELLGRGIHDRIEVTVAGSIPTLVEGLTHRPTDDIDVVNEVPAEIREQRKLLRQIEDRFGLRLGHVQEHYLPRNWKEHRRFLGDFGGIRVYLADVYDVFVSKLSSKQERHKDDLRVMAPQLDKAKAKKRLLGDGKAFLENEKERAVIEENWRFVFRQPLFRQARKGGKGTPRRNEQAKKRKR